MTQGFQMSAIIKVEHQMAPFVLPLDNALAAAQPRHSSVGHGQQQCASVSVGFCCACSLRNIFRLKSKL